MKDLYAVLRVKPNATPDEIKAAYREQARRTHPDVNRHVDALAQFQEVKEAYEVLGTPSRRANYDRIVELERERAAREQEAVRAQFQQAQAASRSGVDDKSAYLKRKSDIDQMIKLVQRGVYAQAETLADDLIKQDHRCAEAYAAKGDIARLRGDLAEAARLYAYAVQFAPNNAVYQRRYEELSSGLGARDTTRNPLSEDIKLGPLGVAVFVALVAALYTALAPERGMMPGAPLLSTLTLGQWAMMFVASITGGAAMSAAGALGRMDAGRSAFVRVAPVWVLAGIGVVSFWLAAGVYVLVGMSQKAFNPAFSRVMGLVGVLVFLFALCRWPAGAMAFGQTLAWIGNIGLMGAVLGWSVADALRPEGT